MKVQGIPAFSNRRTNPYNAFLYEALEERGCTIVEGWDFCSLHDTDIIHIHWPEGCVNQRNILLALLGVGWMLIRINIAKIFGCRIIWTAHNIGTHDRRWPTIEKIFYSLFPRFVDGCIYLNGPSSKKMEVVAPRLRGTRRAIIPHGHYRQGNFRMHDKAEARRLHSLGANHRIYIYFGQIRPYKNVPGLIRTFSNLQDPNSTLIVAGNPGNDVPLQSEICRLATADPRIRLYLRFLSDDELAALIAASDLVVLPYTEISNSGSLILALSHERPTLVPRTPAFLELGHAIGEHWIRYFEGELSAKTMREAMQTSLSYSGPPPELGHLDWHHISSLTFEFYQKCQTGDH